MSRRYEVSFKERIVDLIKNHNHSTSKTAKDFNVPLKTVEKWITAYNKDNMVFKNMLDKNKK